MSDVRVTVPLDLAPPNGISRVTSITADGDSTPTFNAGTTYALGDQVQKDTYYIYESLQAGNLGNTPGPTTADTLYWAFAGFTNKYKMLDGKNTSQTQQTTTGNLFLRIVPGQIVTQLALFNITGADSVRVQFTGVSAIGTTWDVDENLREGAPDWFHYFTDPIERRSAFFMEVPAYSGVTIDITLTNFNIDDVALGTVIVGRSVDLGGVAQTGMRLGIVDYSRKETNDFGDLELVERAYSNKASVQFLVENTRVDYVMRLLATLRATPTLYETTDTLSSARVFGFYKEAEALVAYYDRTLISLDLEGLT